MKVSLNRSEIKFIAILAMTLNHIGTVFLPKDTPLFNSFIYIGHITAILMCYFLVEGFNYTHSKSKYFQRLIIFAIISQPFFQLAFYDEHIMEFSGLNMIFSLSFGFLALTTIKSNLQYYKKTALIFLLILLASISDWSYLSIIFVLLLYLGVNTGFSLKLSFILCGIIDFLDSIITNYGNEPNVNSFNKIFFLSFLDCLGIFVAGFIILYLYNGKEIKNLKYKKFNKWFFYIYYPAHLLIIGLIKTFLLS